MTNKAINPYFSFVILTYNEEVHLPRLLDSIKNLNAPVFILDSGSHDKTLEIADHYQAEKYFHAFENHPKQWDFALNHFNIQTPWTIGLDADQIVTPELFQLLDQFNPEKYGDINGIYFNRKNFFQGTWIRYGGYYPVYLLKMFRTHVGYSDLKEKMDHRFIVPGKTIIWKNGHLIEENLKENDLNFWFEKHERYSDLIAEQEIERMSNPHKPTLKAKFLGNPDQRKAWFRKLWWRLPLGIRPYLYYGFRMILQLGFLDHPKARQFHYLQGLWFRKLVDKKIMAKRKYLSI